MILMEFTRIVIMQKLGIKKSLKKYWNSPTRKDISSI